MNGGPSTGGAPVGGAAPTYQGKEKKKRGLGTIGTGNLSVGKGLGKTGYKGKARTRKQKVQTKAKAVMPGKRRSG
jgi:hypothetical protein